MKHLVYFTATDHYVYSWTRGRLELLAKFPGDDSGVAGFREFLTSRRGALFYAMADLAGEDFHEEQIPYLRGGDREQVVQRRLAQRYRDTRLAAALSLGTVSGERRNERLLLTSFTNTQQLAPWLDALTEAGAKLAGVYSVPLLAPALAARLGVKGGRAFVVSANSAGLRQCFVEEGRLRFARLERTVDMVPDAFAAFVRTETGRLAQYLATLRVLPRDGPPVQVIVIAPPGQRAAFERALVSDVRLSFVTLDAAEAARRSGVKSAPANAGAEQLYLHLAVKRPPREQFARREDRRSYYLWQMQRGLVAAGALGFAVCALCGRRELAGLQRHARARRGELGAETAAGDAGVPAHHLRVPRHADHHRQSARHGDRVQQHRPAHRGAAGRAGVRRRRSSTTSRRSSSTRCSGGSSAPRSARRPSRRRARRPRSPPGKPSRCWSSPGASAPCAGPTTAPSPQRCSVSPTRCAPIRRTACCAPSCPST